MNIASNVPVVSTMIELPALVDNLLLLLSDKEKNVIKKRFNLNDKGKFTLEEIGSEFSVTRERVRQIEKNALSKMRRNVFNTALKNLHEYIDELVKKNGGLIRKELLVKGLSEVLPDQALLHLPSLDLSLVLHGNLDSVGNTIEFHPYVRDKKMTDYLIKHAADQLFNLLNKYGDVKSIVKLHTDLKDFFTQNNFDLGKLKSLINIDKRLTLIDEDFVALMVWRHINPRTLRDKILYILRNEKNPMHFVEVANKISTESFDTRKVNVQAVHNELIRHDNFVLIGRGIYALKDWGYERGTVAEVIKGILKEKGELTQDEIIEAVLQRRQVKRITIILALKNSKKFVRVGRKIYKLKA